jgi:hypothetical protein
MRKVIKILAKVLSTIILLSIFLPISITLLLSVDSIQNFVVDKATEFTSNWLGTKVSIDRVDLDLFSKIRVQGFYVEDYNQDTLIYAGEAKARIASLDIKRTGLVLEGAVLSDAKLHIRELPSGELNIRPIVQKLTSKEGKGDFRLYINDMKVNNVEFVYERLVHRNPVYGVDYNDMLMRNINGEVHDFAVVKGVVTCDIWNLSGEEKSGFKLDDFSAELLVDKGLIEFTGLSAETQHSAVRMPRMTISGRDWLQYKYYIDSVHMDGVVDYATVHSSDIAYFAPNLREWDVTLKDVDASFEGYVRDLAVQLNSASVGDNSSISGNAHIVGLPDWRNSQYDIKVDEAQITSSDALMLVAEATRKELPAKAQDIVKNLEWVNVAGTYKGDLRAFHAKGRMNSSAGKMNADVHIRRHHSSIDVRGDVTTKGLDVGRVLNIPNLHRVDAHLVGEGNIGDVLVGKLKADVEGVEFGSYRYKSITAEGEVNGGDYLATVSSADENLDFDMWGAMNLDIENPTYNLSLDLRRADLHAIGINKRDTTAVLSLQLGLEAEGHTIDDLVGTLSIADAEYQYPDNTVNTDLILLSMYGDEGLRAAQLKSDFLDVQFQSYLSYRDVYSYVYNFMMTYIPLLYDDSAEKRPMSREYEVDNTMVKITAGEKINEFLDAIASSLLVAPDTEAYLAFSPSANKMMMRGSSEALEYRGVIMANTSFNIDKKIKDSLSLWLESSCVYVGSRPLMPDFTITGGARENRASIRAGFESEDGKASGMLGFKANFSRDSLTHRRNMHLDITPSHFTNDSVQWRLLSRGIDIESSRISVNQLRLIHPGQQLIVDGVVSRSREDELLLTLDNFDISPLSALVRRWGYEVEGSSNGYAVVKSALSNPEIEANIELDSLRVNGLLAPPQRVTSDWDFAENRARVYISDRITQDTTVRGYYQPVGNRYLATAKMNNLKLELIQPFLRGVVSDIDGTGDIDIRIAGKGRMAQLNGSAVVRDIGVSVDFTQVRYTAPYGELRVENNHIYADGVKLYDSEGHEGKYTMDLSLEHLSNVTYDIDISASDMLVLDTKAKDNDLFYGHIYASGSASFRGDKRGLKMDITGTSAGNSQFFMPLMGKENVSYADFVKFTEAKVEAPDTTTFLTRRMMAHARNKRSVNNISSVMDIDMTMNVGPNVDMQLVIDPTLGDIIKGKGSGQLTLHYVPKANVLDMRGTYTISEGSYLFTLQNIWHKKFTMEPGSTISWNGDPMAAQLNIDAIYKTKASLKPLLGGSMRGVDTSRAVPVDCYIKLTDDMMEPTVTFDVQVPNVAPEIQTIVNSALADQQSIATQMFWLLAANTFAADDTSAMGASFSAATGFEMLSNQLSNWLSGDDYNVVFRYRPRTDLTGDEVDFGFSKSMLNDRLIVEVEGGYLSDESLKATERASNFVGEAFITWLIDKDGAFRLKGFTQTIDRYGENQGMQEAGLGIYYSESFNTFEELGKSLKDRFVNPERRQRRRERREQRRAERMRQDSIEARKEDVEVKIAAPQPLEIDNEEFIVPKFDTNSTE